MPETYATFLLPEIRAPQCVLSLQRNPRGPFLHSQALRNPISLRLACLPRSHNQVVRAACGRQNGVTMSEQYESAAASRLQPPLLQPCFLSSSHGIHRDICAHVSSGVHIYLRGRALGTVITHSRFEACLPVRPTERLGNAFAAVARGFRRVQRMPCFFFGFGFLVSCGKGVHLSPPAGRGVRPLSLLRVLTTFR